MEKSWQNAIVGNAVNIPATTGFANNTSALASVANSATEIDSGTAVTVAVGNTGTLPAETFTNGSPGNYASTLSCTGGTLSGTNATTSNTLTINAANAGASIVCTYTNSRTAQQINLVKTWANGGAGHTAGVTTTGGTNNPSFSSTAPTTTNGSAVTVYAGDVLTLPAETFGGGATAGQYNVTVACAGGSTLASGPVGRTLTISNSASPTTCTYDNSRRLRTVTVNKSVSPASDPGRFILQINGATVATNVGNGGNGSTANLPVGSTVMISELDGTVPVTSLANYTTTLSCTGGVTPTAGPNNRSGQFTLPDADISCTFVNTRQTATLTLVKSVTNNNGGTLTVADFPLTATGPDSVVITGVSGTAAVTNRTVPTGVYTLSEVAQAGYVAGAWSCTAGTLNGSQLTLANGQNATCTIVNDDQPATLTLAKLVNGGPGQPEDWTLTATGPTNLSGISGSAAVTNVSVSAGTYALSEAGGPAGSVYAASPYSCVVNGAAPVAGNTLSLNPGDTAACTITNSFATIELSKTATVIDSNGNTVLGDPGDEISYAFEVTNTGTIGLGDTAVTDPLLGGAACTVTGPLAPGASGGCTATTLYTIVAGDLPGPKQNTASAVADAPGTLVDPTASAVVDTPLAATPVASIALSKTATSVEDTNGNGINDTGDVIRWSFRIENTGNVPLTNVTVNEQLAGVVLTGGSIANLAPGAADETTFSAAYTIQVEDAPGAVVNSATASATAAGVPDPVVSEVSTTSTPAVVPQPAISLVKTVSSIQDVNGNGVTDAGDVIRWSFRVENTGNVPLSGVTVVDELDGIVLTGGPIASLAPGVVDTSTFSASYTIAESDADGGVANSATARGTPPPLAGVPQLVVSSTVSTTMTTVARPSANIVVTKRAGLRLVQRGDVVPYSIEIENREPAAATIDVVDKLPAGFLYVPDSAELGGAQVAPTVSGRNVRFANVAVPAGGMVVITLQARVGASVQPGDHVNYATVVTPGTDSPLGPAGKATVRLRIEHVFDCGEIIGKVFDDRNRNGYQDESEGEAGLPGVRLATVRGLLITTDRHGRFSVPCADIPEDQIGSNFILKLDTRTLPTGYRLTTENPRVVRLTKGKLTKLNFGAAIDKVVRIDLSAAAFERGTGEPGKELRQGLAGLIPVLSKQHSVVRLTYFAGRGEDREAKARLKAVTALLRRQWKQDGGSYELGIETKIVRK